jgi:hypothetical protein
MFASFTFNSKKGECNSCKFWANNQKEIKLTFIYNSIFKCYHFETVLHLYKHRDFVIQYVKKYLNREVVSFQWKINLLSPQSGSGWTKS